MKIELNVTLACNRQCPNCNRLCHMYKTRTEHMTSDQIKKMIGQLNRPISRVKIAGGEPLLNPDIVEICALLAESNWIEKVKIDSNGIIPYPVELRKYPKIRLSGRVPAKKIHLPVFVAPCDMGVKPTLRCSVPRLCGMSLDAHGWLPCSAAIAIVRAFHLDHLYRNEMPPALWGLNELCRFCVFGMPQTWRTEHAKPLNKQFILITNSWKKALNDSDGTTNVELF